VQAARLDSAVDYLDLGRWAAETPRAVALAGPSREPLTYSALWDHVRATSETLVQAGVQPSSVAALALPNGPNFLTAALAITLRSACAPVELDLTPDEYRIRLRRLGASALILEDGAGSPVANVARELGMRLIHLQSSPDAPAGIFRLGGAEGPANHSPGRQTDTALLLMTSATTGTPKLVPRSRGAIRTAAAHNAQAFQLTANDRYLSCMPLAHSHGIGEAVAQLTVGGSIFCTPAFEADKFSTWLGSFRPTWFSASPTMNRIVLTLARETPGIFQRSPLRFIRSAAAAPDPEVLLSLEQLLGIPVLNGYGLTEVPCAIRSTPSLRKPGAVGKSVGTEVAILDESGAFLPPDSEGEILLRGPTVMSGYLDDPEANRTAFHEGWFRTGDLGRLDHDGFLFVVGRRKEMINRGGKKVSPQEVDSALATHPALAEVASFAIPHRTLGEDVAAAVVLRPGAQASELDLRRFAAEQLAAYKIPRRILFVENIPRTAVGKPKRSALAEQFRDLAALPQRLHPSSPEAQRPPTAIETQVIDIWRRVLGVEQLGVEDDFFDLGGDSLSAALMLAQAEKMLDPDKRPFDGSRFFDQPTVARLAGILAESAAAPEELHSGPTRTLTLQKDGSRIPFFCFSNSTINPYQFRYLSRELGPDQPFAVVCPPPAAQSHRLLRVHEIARQSADAIRALRKHGPYVLGGYCYGGVVAFETARQLLEEGEEVALLALFDTPTPGYPKIVRQWKRYARQGAALLGGLARGKVPVSARDIAAHLGALRRVATRRWFAKAKCILASPSVTDSPAAAEEWNSVVMREYTPRVFRAPIVQFLAEDVPISTTLLDDRRLGWRDFAKRGFQILRVPGDHISMLAEGNALTLAAELEKVLQAATGGAREIDFPAAVVKR
jgi:oxalate---CoA ligase